MPYIDYNALTDAQREDMLEDWQCNLRGLDLWEMVYKLSCVLAHRWSELDRGWHAREQQRYQLHPVIRKAINAAPPENWHLLTLEWPHISQGDPTRIAYTRSDEHGRADRQTVTTIGKYLRRHFPVLHDHTIRDLAAAYDAGKCYVLRDMDEMLSALQRGPQSCMKWHDCTCDNHPYRTYDPSLGWGLAVREVGGDIKARALVYEGSKYHQPAHPYFVRSFNKPDDNGYSYSDTRLEAWLKDQGYRHQHGYEGALMAYIPTKSSFLAPYIDGNCQDVNIVTVHAGSEARRVLQVVDSGDYTCASTNGLPDESEDESFYCDCCQEYYDDDERSAVGYHEDYEVCSGCRENYYTYGYGRNGRQYYFSSDDALWVEGLDAYVHCDYLSDNEVVCDVDGDYREESECIRIDGEWYPEDDDRIVEDVDGVWQVKEDCEEIGGSWYLRSDDRIVCNDEGDWVLVADMDNESGDEEGEEE